MKKKLLHLTLLLFSFSAFAQCTVNNSGFENWTTLSGTSYFGTPYSFDQPTQTWYSPNDQSSYFIFGTGIPVLNKTTDKYTGQYALKMTANANSGNVMYGIGKVNYYPANLTGYYKFNGQAPDSIEILIAVVDDSLTHKVSARDTANMLLYGRSVVKSTVNTYSNFTIPLHKTSTVTPDSFAISIFVFNHHSTAPINAWFDDICFEGTTGITENEFITESTFFNTGNNKFVLSMNSEKPMESVTASVFDLSGREVYSKSLTNQTSTKFMEEFNLQHLTTGIYLLQVRNNFAVINKKFQVQ